MAVTEEQLKALREKARRVRIDILKMLTECGSGHTGGSLSATDIVTALYFYKMKYDPKTSGLEGAGLILSSPRDTRHRSCTRRWPTRASSSMPSSARSGSWAHGSRDIRTASTCPGVEISTGSLGQGLSVANG